jgi:hypothetical protein
MGTHSGMSHPRWPLPRAQPERHRKIPEPYGGRGSFHAFMVPFLIKRRGSFALRQPSRAEPTRGNRYRETAFDPEPTAQTDPGCAKTRAFNLLVESSSQFGQSENQKCWRRLSEEDDREDGSTLSWLAHVFTRPGPFADVRPSPLSANPDSCIAANKSLFNHLVGAGEQRRRHVEGGRTWSAARPEDRRASPPANLVDQVAGAPLKSMKATVPTGVENSYFS